MSRLAVPVGGRDHVLGPTDAMVTVLEYGDYQCPHCAAAHPIVAQLQLAVGDRMRFAYRHFPLVTMHPFAELAAEASEIAGDAGVFWAMHDLLFERQDELDPQGLLRMADDLGLDEASFVDHLDRRMHRPKVKEDFRGGVRSGVNGTPTFFLNGERYDGPFGLEPMIAAIGHAVQSGAD